jgi:asparagine synthase (glutamine-hydrolysing)
MQACQINQSAPYYRFRKEFDEAPYARAIEHIGSEHHEYYISANDGLSLIEELPKYWDEPFADSSQISTLLVAKMARQKVKVCLSGDGGDELFCGYNRYFASVKFWSIQQQLPYWLRQIISKAIVAIPPHAWQSTYALLKGFTGNRPTQANVGLKIHKLAGMMQMASLYAAYRDLMSYWQEPGDVLGHPGEAASIMDRQPNPGLGHFINDAMYWDQLGYLIDDNLVKGDRASMAFSLEARSPLLDHRIIELSWRLPLAMKYRDGQSNGFTSSALPLCSKAMINQPKMGFSVPIRLVEGPLKTGPGIY